jgi:hypothetical protein
MALCSGLMRKVTKPTPTNTDGKKYAGQVVEESAVLLMKNSGLMNSGLMCIV